MKRLLFVLALVIASAVPVPAFAAGCDGVTVVVDFRGLGGGVQQGCAAGSPATGVAALTAAGFGYTYASRQPGFVCRINGMPGADTDRCVATSPASAYWSYWHAPAGGSWSYSNQGAASRTPARGTVEGWAFGAGEQPGVAPPAAPAPQPQQPVPAPVNPPAAQPRATTTTTTTTPPATSSSAATTSASSQPPVAAAATTTDQGAIVIKEVPSSPQEKAGSGWLWTAIGVLVIAALVIAGLLVARRRRAVEEE